MVGNNVGATFYYVYNNAEYLYLYTTISYNNKQYNSICAKYSISYTYHKTHL